MTKGSQLESVEAVQAGIRFGRSSDSDIQAGSVVVGCSVSLERVLSANRSIEGDAKALRAG